MKKMRFALSVLLSLTFISCSHSNKSENFNKDVFAGECENAYLHIPENSDGLRLVRKTQEATGTALHYAATGAGYFAEYTAHFSAGVLIVVVACAPAILGGGNQCIPVNSFDTKNFIPKIGSKTKKATAKWSCSNINPLSQQVRQVAACFKSRGTKVDLLAAKSTLENFRKSENVYDCLSEIEREHLTDDLNALNTSSPGEN